MQSACTTGAALPNVVVVVVAATAAVVVVVAAVFVAAGAAGGDGGAWCDDGDDDDGSCDSSGRSLCVSALLDVIAFVDVHLLPMQCVLSSHELSFWYIVIRRKSISSTTQLVQHRLKTSFRQNIEASSFSCVLDLVPAC